MPHFHLRLFGPQPPLNRLPNTLVWPLYGYVVEYTHFQQNKLQSNYHVSITKNISPSFASVGSFPRLHLSGALQMRVDLGRTSDFGKYFQKKINIDLYEKQTLNMGFQIDGSCDSPEKLSDEDHKERQRRRKIGLANKGRVPWNKGRKHSAETCERIKQRTIEALRDPKVRKKMSKHSLVHSDQSKARIGSSLRRVWGERLKWKQLREKFFLLWVDSIAKAAKKGGSEQNELDWDSYEKVKQEIALQQLQWAAEKEKAKVMAKIRAEGAAQANAEKKARLAQKRKQQEQKAKARKEIKRKARRKLKEDKEELAVAQGLKLRQRLIKLDETPDLRYGERQNTIGLQFHYNVRFWRGLKHLTGRTRKIFRTISDWYCITCHFHERCDL